tara:strand:+ start:1213 stop:1446 length:234 start_codon:yes stop_codon:yes gene_type:complete
MIKPFQIVWELIEFGLQALFLYVLVIIIFIGVIAYVIAENKSKEHLSSPEYIRELIVEKECTRIDGCRVLGDGTIEY